MTMRTWSEGTVRVLHGRWQYMVHYSDDNGQRHMVTQLSDGPSEATTEQKAKEGLRAWRDSLIVSYVTQTVAERYEAEIAAIKAGIPAEALARLQVPFSDYADRCIEARRVSRADGRVLERTTVDGYRSLLRSNVLPYLPEGVTVAEVDRRMVEDVLVGLQKAGYTQGTCKKAYNLINSVMAHAVEEDGLPRNPCEGVPAPKVSKPRLNPLSLQDADALAARLADMDATAVVTAARLALACGLREGEICGLTFGDIDERNGWLHVRRAIGKAPTGGTTYVKMPKTDAGTRSVPLNDELRDVIRARRLWCLREWGREPRGADYLIGNADGTWLKPPYLGRAWAALSREALGIKGLRGDRVTFHDLRHTFATVALARGMAPKDVQAVLGHASAQTTLDVYAASDPSARQTAMELISRR